ncbi:contact-dependent growth inhibition system immunity protein [Streptomyces sp. NPDC095613]|uniref:contact-dependent growth inhibition system immunity protein n=1 Tax=Streptomyces sp. NPDC095613 TaxID=3155540 RepID=UPI00331EDFF5
MPLGPLEHDRAYGELDQVVGAHLGRLARDEEALTAYLRHTWRTRPWALAVAGRQLRECAASGGDRADIPVPDVGLPDDEIRPWLLALAERVEQSVTAGQAPPPATPRTHWEWHARFPELGQFLGCWFSQAMPAEFENHDAALRDYLAGTHPDLVAALAGELHELLALPLGETDHAVAVTELGMEVAPPAPYTPSGWLATVAVRLMEPEAERRDRGR